MRANLKKIAEELNVSVMTVSRALRGDRGVSEETRERIRKFAEQVNYQPNLVARSLVSKRTHVLGVIIPDYCDSFWLDAVIGVERVARAVDYHVLLSHSSGDPELERGEIQTLVGRQVDALLLASCASGCNADLLHEVMAGGVPVVLLDRRAEGNVFPGAYAADYDGAKQAVEHLVGLGYRRIAHMNGNLQFSTARDRLRAYRDAVQAAGLPEIIENAGYQEEGGFRAMQTLLERDRPDAVFSANDPAAIGALRFLQETGARVPDDVALVGFGNIHCAEHVAVPLTTVIQPRQELGEAAAKLALQCIEHGPETPPEILLPTRLIVRRSCGAHLRRN